MVHRDADAPVGHRGQGQCSEAAVALPLFLLAKHDLGLLLRERFRQRPIPAAEFRIQGGPHPQGVPAPGLDAQGFALAAADQGIFIFNELHGTFLLPFFPSIIQEKEEKSHRGVDNNLDK